MARQPARSAAQFLPAKITLPALKEAAASCQGCDLYQHATQTVFGEGSPHAKVILLGEQPGDQEDRTGHPFVGPAGKILDKALAEAGLARDEVYITNAVKHFKWEPQGKRRKHKRPSAAEMAACRPWLTAELQLTRPDILVCLGATAAQAILGGTTRLHAVRGRFIQTEWTPSTFVTVHPSSILRQPDPAARETEYERFVQDLKAVAARIHARTRKPQTAKASQEN
jgi:DNA polymerase